MAGTLMACSVPVCRYALERWKADLFDVVVFHDAPLSQQQHEILDSLRPDENGKKPANVHVTLVNVNEEVPPLFQPMWEANRNETLPRMVVRYPDPRVAPDGFWSNDISRKSIGLLLDSKVRRLVGEELVKGTSAVWILLESGDSEKDAAAEKRILDRLEHLEHTLEISKPDAQDIEEGLVAIDPDKLELSFRMFRLSRTDATESFFVDSLLNTEKDLRDDEYAGQPMAFPIFGRGRCLYALIGDGIDNDNIDEACQFLAGPCSCQVKNQNPGVDMLMATDWDALVNATIDVDNSLPPLVGLQGFEQSDSKIDSVSSTTTTDGTGVDDSLVNASMTGVDAATNTRRGSFATTKLPVDTGVSSLRRNLVMLAMGAGVVVVLLSIFVVRRQS